MDAHDEAARAALPCLCDAAYVARGLIAPDCPQCQFADDVAAALRRAAADAAKAEREECAQAVYDTEVVRIGSGFMQGDDAQASLNAAEKAIRARGTGGA